jgi:hypothetical protein
MMSIITQLLEAKTGREVDAVVEKNILKLCPHQRQHLCHLANRSKMRIMRVNAEKKKSFEGLLN